MCKFGFKISDWQYTFVYWSFEISLCFIENSKHMEVNMEVRSYICNMCERLKQRKWVLESQRALEFIVKDMQTGNQVQKEGA